MAETGFVMGKKKKKKNKRHHVSIIGIDQSYTRTGISLASDGKLVKVASVDLRKLNSKHEKRDKIRKTLDKIIKIEENRSDALIVIIERTRVFSGGKMSLNYLKAAGGLNAAIVDAVYQADPDIPIYSVDTKAWKNAILGYTGGEENDFGVNPKKYPMVKYVIESGFEDSIKKPVGKQRKNGVFQENGKWYEYDDDAADSAGIALYGFYGDLFLLREED